MKTTAFLFAACFCVNVLQAAIIEKVVVLTKEDIAQRREVLPWAAVWQDRDQVIVKLSLHEAYSTPGKFASYSLRVLYEPIDPQELTKSNFNSSLIKRSESSTSKSASFRINTDEVDRAYLVISSWTGEQDGKAKMTSECVMISTLVAMAKPLRIEIDPVPEEGNVGRPDIPLPINPARNTSGR
ncbi:MAG: hypothetical protein QM760_10060 [Nibricoccus sp.]